MGVEANTDGNWHSNMKGEVKLSTLRHGTVALVIFSSFFSGLAFALRCVTFSKYEVRPSLFSHCTSAFSFVVADGEENKDEMRLRLRLRRIEWICGRDYIVLWWLAG